MQQVFNVIAAIAVIVIVLYVGAALLDTVLDFADGLLWSLRYRILPGAVRIAAIIVGAWIIWRIAKSI